MKKRALLATLTAGTCLLGGTCLSLNTDALLAQGGDILCAAATSGLPGADRIDYCSAIDIDLTAAWPETTE